MGTQARKAKATAKYEAPETATELHSIIESIIAECGRPERVLELYYWSQQADLLEMIRALSELPAPIRAALNAFLCMASEREKISAQIGEYGELTLFSGHVAEALTIVRAAIEEDERKTGKS